MIDVPTRAVVVVTAAQKTGRVLRSFVEFSFSEGVRELYQHLRALPREEARLTWVGLALAGVIVLATPLLAAVGPWFDPLVFQDENGVAQVIPAAALVLALAAFALAWSYVLCGAAQGPGVVWILVATFYTYLLLYVGSAVGRSYLHLIVFLLPVMLAALTAEGQKWGKIIFAVAVASVAIRATPVSSLLRVPWYVLWIPCGVLMVALHTGIARRPWPLPSARVALATAGTTVYLIGIATSTPQSAVLAKALNLALNSVTGMLELLWFLLGVSFVSGALALGQFARRVVELGSPWLHVRWVVLVGGTVLSLWVLRFPVEGEFAARPWGAVLLVVLAAGLMVRWRRRGMTEEWLAGWFVVTVAALALLQAYATLDIGEILTREAGLLSVLGFTYAMVWEVVGRIPKVPLAAQGFRRPAPLLLYVGVVLLIGAASLFGLAAHLTYFQQVVILRQYRGAISLWIPMVLLLVLRSVPGFSPAESTRLIHAFVLGALVAVPAFLLRASGLWGADVVGLAAVVALALYLVRRWSEITAWLPSAAVGAAIAAGFAVSLSQRLLVYLLAELLSMSGAMSTVPVLTEAGKAVFDTIGTAVWRPVDGLVYYLIGPALAGAMAVVMAWIGAGRLASPNAATRAED